MRKSLAAKQWANSYIKQNKNILTSLISGDSGTYYRSELLVEEYGALNTQGFYEIDGKASVYLHDRANKDFFALKAIKTIISHNIEMGQKIPEYWREMHASIVRGEDNKVLKSKRRETKEWRNFIALIMAVKLMDKFNLPLSFNPLSKRGESAVEIICEVMNKNGITPIIECSALETGIRRLPKFYLSDKYI